MRTNHLYRVCLALIVGGFCLSRAAQAVQYDVFLLGGQSNMDGRGIAADHDMEPGSPQFANYLNTANYAKYNPTQTDVKMYYYNEAAVNIRNTLMQKWLDLKPGYSEKTAIGAGKYYFGPEVSFGRKMADAMPGHNVALIKYSVGGTNLRENWNPDTPGPQYANFKSTVNDALAAITARGDTYVVRGMIWHQGESDNMMPDGTTYTPTATYEAQLKNFIGSVREDLSLPNLPFIVGQVGSYGSSTYARTNIRAAQLNTANTYDKTGFASASGLRLWDTTTHFDANSQITLGERFADAMIAEMVPEPGSLMLLGAGSLLLLRRTRRAA